MEFIATKARIILVSVMILLFHFTKGQQQIADIVYLDSVMVLAQKSGFSVDEFIGFVLEDESFYQAFKNLRHTSYSQSTAMRFEDGKRPLVTYEASHQQTIQGNCRKLTLLAERSSDRFYRGRKQKIRYYTATVYDRIFAQTGTFCRQDIVETAGTSEGIEGHVEALKQLIFSPGKPADVPFLKSRTAIFSSKMRKRYTYHINARDFRIGNPAYVFEVHLRPEYMQSDDNRTLIKSMVTWFSKDDFQVLGRTYRLAQKALLYDFEVEMDISLEKHSGDYLPHLIRYQGWWNIPTRRKEEGSFEIAFDYPVSKQ